MYYIWETRRRNDNEALISKFAPTAALFGVSFIRGRRFAVDIPGLEIVLDKDSQGTLTDDLVFRKRRCLVHSHRLTDVLRSAGVDNIDYYPCEIINEVTGERLKNYVNSITGSTRPYYQAANILDLVFCIDKENSDLEFDDEEPNEMWYINHLKLLEDRLDGLLMFRLGEDASVVIVHQSVKEAVENAGMTGVVFLPAEGYRDYQGYAFDNPRNVIGTHDNDPEGPADAL